MQPPAIFDTIIDTTISHNWKEPMTFAFFNRERGIKYK